MNGLLILEDGQEFEGQLICNTNTVIGEVCLFTGMTGYQEAFTDPSYFGQIILMSNAHIGNYGCVYNESESKKIMVSGAICRNFSQHNSRTNSISLKSEFESQSKSMLCDVDTRAVVNHLRKNGNMNAAICLKSNRESALEMLIHSQKMAGLNVASKLKNENFLKDLYAYGDVNFHYGVRVGVLNFGVKENILNELVNREVNLTIYEQDSLPNVYDMDGYLISNGPGDPSSMKKEIEVIKKLVESGKPVFGICLGHQLLALSQGLKTFKMKTGHRGCNHAVLNKKTGLAEVTSQNHGFAVEMFERDDIEVTHINLNDGTVEGLRLKNRPVFSVQHHPEACAGPHDSNYLFDEFIKLVKQHAD